MVLNKSTTRISPQTSEAVRRAAAELGYQPNLTARSLRTNRTQLIGMISDYVASSPYATGIIQGAQEAAWSREHLLLIVNTEGDTRHENDLVQALSARQVDGFLYAAMSHQECEVPVALEGQHVVGVDMHIGTAGPSFVPAESAAATTATEALLAAGHHRIGHLRGRPHATASGLRAHAFIETMRAAGCLDESLIVAHP
ncbi:MAG: LacI family transcriptional regulator, partial [Micrococcales bacterium]